MRLSVVLASCRSAELVRQALDALTPQCRASGAELIVARSVPLGQADPERLFDGCVVVPLPSGATIPEIRGAGLSIAKGEAVLLTEDNCTPRKDWVGRLASGFERGADVVGGTMGNAHPDRAVDSGAYYAEYGFFGPLRSAPGGGASPFVTGANVAYRRSVVERAAAWASAGEWEGVIHHRLAADGARFVLVNDAVVEQNVHCEFRSFCRDRLEHAYAYATVRRAGWGSAKRAAMALATPVLPPLLTWRAWRHAGRSDPGGFVKAMPYTLAFFTAWAAGEAAAYLGISRP
jgi:hypothetical protein